MATNNNNHYKKTSHISKIKDLNKSASPRFTPKTKSGDSAKSLARMSPSAATALSVPSTTSKTSSLPRFYIYGGYQILNGMMADFYSINLEDSQEFNWKPV